MPSDLMTADEAASYLRVNVNTLRRYIREGKLRAAKVGRAYYLRRRELDEFLSARGLPPVVDSTPGTGRADEILRERSQSDVAPREGRRDEESSEWLDADIGPPLPPFDWGSEGVPMLKPVRFVPGQGLIIEGGRGDER